ncbi:unnamed protein product [Auanema sp. JU1783]|nr:unnamed protein product [Auanema sp. JU1783]
MIALQLIATTVLLAHVAFSQEVDNAEIQARAIASSNNDQLNNGDKFKVYVGTIDGVRRELFNEVDGAEEFVPNDNGNFVDPFGAYDDNLIISTENEKNLFVPKPYRPNGQKKEDKKPTTTTPRPTLAPTTIRTVPPIIQTLPTIRPTAAPTNFGREQFRPIQPLQTRPPIQTTQVPFTRPTPVPFRPVPQQPFQPQRPQQQFRPEPLPQVITPNRQTPPPPQPRPTPAPFRPQQPQFTRSQFRTTPQTTQAPRLPFAGTQNLRTGVCPASIFYISTPITGPSRLTFTHFAVAVTVDQCARTCHEFNCAIAHYNPTNGHCEFNPSTAFAIRNGQCPAWPSLHYRNNVVASESVRIFCVQCQRPRRRLTTANSRLRNGLTGPAFDQRQRTLGSFRPATRHHVIHGVLVKQPQAVSLGTSQQQFISNISDQDEGESLANTEIKSKIAGTSQHVPSLEQEEDQLVLVKELEKLQS